MSIDKKAKLIRKAIKYAEKKHKTQKRKFSGSPYIHHPLMVSYLVANYKKSKHLHILIAAAILHDVVEDTSASPESVAKKFGKMVASLVFELTDDKDLIKEIGKVQYQKNKWAGLSSYGLMLKLCDRLANISDSPSEQYKQDTVEILEHLTLKRDLTSSQSLLVSDILRLCKPNIFCSNCNSQALRAGQLFCHSCGSEWVNRAQ